MKSVRFQMWSVPSALAIGVGEVAIADDGEVVATLELSPEAWLQVDAFSLFGLDPGAFEQRDRFDDDRPVRARVRLDPAFAADLPPDGARIVALLEERDASQPDDPLLDPASWTVIDLSQDVDLPDDAPAGTLRQGVVTAAGRGEPLLEAVVGYLDAEELAWERPSPATEVVVDGEPGRWDLVVRTLEDVAQVVVLVRLTTAVPSDRRDEMMRLVTGLNVELTVVWYELAEESGAVSAQTGLSFAGLDPVPALVGALVRPAVAAFERFLPAVEAIAAGELDVADL